MNILLRGKLGKVMECLKQESAKHRTQHPQNYLRTSLRTGKTKGRVMSALKSMLLKINKKKKASTYKLKRDIQPGKGAHSPAAPVHKRCIHEQIQWVQPHSVSLSSREQGTYPILLLLGPFPTVLPSLLFPLSFLCLLRPFSLVPSLSFLALFCFLDPHVRFPLSCLSSLIITCCSTPCLPFPEFITLTP